MGIDTEPLRVGCVGLGRWAKVIAAAVARTGKLEIVNCFSRSEASRTEFAQIAGCDQADSYEALLADERVEGVLLVTPNNTHADLIEQAAIARKHIWVEKPIAQSVADALKIRAVLDQYPIIFAVGHCARMLGASRKIKELVEGGYLGDLSLIEAHWSTGRALSLTPDEWRWHRDASPGGPLIQLLVHHFDTVQYLFGPIVEVQAYQRRNNTQGEVDDVATVIAQFESGHLGYLGSSWVSPGVYRLNIYGTQANIYQEIQTRYWSGPAVDRHTTLVQQSAESKESIEFIEQDMVVAELEDFTNAIRHGRPAEVGWYEATQALACVWAAIQSSQQGRAVAISEVLGS